MAATPLYLELDRFIAVPLSLSSSLRSCPCRPLSSRTLILGLPQLKNNNTFGLVFEHPKSVRCSGRSSRRGIVTSVSHLEPDRFGEGKAREEDDPADNLSTEVDPITKDQQKVNQLKNRIFFGVGIGISAGIIILAGEWVFTTAIAAAIFLGAREYFELVRSRGIAAGMTPPPRYVSHVCSVICTLMPIATLYFGQIDVAATFAAFFVAISLLLQRGNPRFAQLSSTMFGFIYCGYLPCFWIKLRCGLSIPALNTTIAVLGVIGQDWPILLGGQAHWTVGLVATLICCSSVIAADTFAFMGGKAFGRTPLTSVSPKKTWEGTIIGLGGCIATSVVLSKFLYWPTSLLSAIAFGFLNFFGSIFGDLTESMIKRDAGVKDSGSLIPGHGGLLDRMDSYIFTGALAYSFIKIFLPLYGV